MQFSDLNILDFGHKIMASGIMFTDGKNDFVLQFPNEQFLPSREALHPTIEQWEQILKQTDDVLIQSNRADKFQKVFVKKSQRNLEQAICWKVYTRDNFRCRYCYRLGVPLTVDHIDLWEAGGITTEENLNTSCKQCNRNRGNMLYGDWLASPQYKAVRGALPHEVLEANEKILEKLPELEKRRVNYKRNR